MEVFEMLADVKKPTADKIPIKINVTPAAKAVVERIADQNGMKEFIVASRIYEWFGAQDDIYQRAVLGMLDGLEVDAAKAFMERWAAESGRIVSADAPPRITHIKGGKVIHPATGPEARR